MADMSFLPEDYVERRMQRRTNAISLVLFVLVMGAVVAAYFVTDQQRSEVQKTQAVVARQFADAAQRLDELQQLKSRKEQMLRKARVTAGLVERIRRSVVIAQVTNMMPTSMSLLSMDLETKIVNRIPAARTSLQAAKQKAKADKAKEQNAIPEAPPEEVTVDIVGICSTDVEISQFMEKLSQSPLFEPGSVTLVFSEQQKVRDQEVRKFRIQAMVNQAVDMKQFEPLKVSRELKNNPMSPEVEHKGELPIAKTDGE